MDADGVLVRQIAADYAFWLDSSTIAGEGDGSRSPGAWDLTIYGLNGAVAETVSGPFEDYLVAFGHHLAAGRAMAKGDENEGTNFKIWNGSSLSDWVSGIPVAWSPDGTRLAVIQPSGPQTGGIGTSGRLALLDASGVEIARVDDYTGRTYEPAAFSPDGRYLATCLAAENKPSAVRVVDTTTGSVSDVASDKYGDCGFYADWSNEPTLYLDDDIDPPSAWTPSQGVIDAGLPAQSVVAVSANGDLANWTGPDGTLRVISNGGETTYSLPGNIDGALWSPDGSRIAVSVDGALTMVVPGSTPEAVEPSPPVPVDIDAAEASFIASAFFSNPKTQGAGTDVDTMQSTTPRFAIDTATSRPAWIVDVSGTTSGPSKGQTGKSEMELSIDAQTSDVRIVSRN